MCIRDRPITLPPSPPPSAHDSPTEDRQRAEKSRWVSAHTGSGLVELTEAIGAALGREALPVKICLTPVQGRLHAWLHSIDAVVEEQSTEQGGWNMQVLIDDQGRRRLDQEQVEINP